MNAPLGFDAWVAARAIHNRAVMKSDWLDTFCSRSEWSRAAHMELSPPRGFRGKQEGESFTCFAGPVERDRLAVLEPMEAMWGLGCPLVGENAFEMFLEHYVHNAYDFDAVLVTGIDVSSSLAKAITATLGDQGYFAGTTGRLLADLKRGFEPYWASRSRNLRKSVKRSLSRAQNRGVLVNRWQGESRTAAFQRILEVERRSWKGMERVGMADTMRGFYKRLLELVEEPVEIQLLFAQVDDIDVGYILGAVVGGVYRGLQFAYDDDYRDVGVGNLLQYNQLLIACELSCNSYDFGTEMPYKERWADSCMRTGNWLVFCD